MNANLAHNYFTSFHYEVAIIIIFHIYNNSDFHKS